MKSSIKMGCIVGKSTAERVLNEVQSKKQRIEECENQLRRPEAVEMAPLASKSINFSIDQELRMSHSNFKLLSTYFPLEDDQHIIVSNKLNNFSTNEASELDYIVLKLEESEREKMITQRFVSLLERLKKSDAVKCELINSKALSVEKLIIQGAHVALQPNLQKIKDDQIMLSSYRGGGFEDIVLRVNKRHEIDRDLQIIQTALEKKQYLEVLNLDDSESKTLQSEITELRNTKNDLERAWDMVKINTKSNDEEIRQLHEELAELLPVVEAKNTEVEPFRIAKQEVDVAIHETLETKALIEGCEQEILQKTEEYNNLLGKNTEKTGQFLRLRKFKAKIEQRLAQKQEIEQIIKELESRTDSWYEGCEEDEEKLKQLEEEESDLCIKSLDYTKAIDDLIMVHKTKIKGLIVMRLKSETQNLIESRFNTWKYQVKKVPVNDTFNMLKERFTTDFNSEDLKEANNLMLEENKEIMEKNSIMLNIKESNEKPMSLVNLFKFLEELMDKKNETDLKDLKEFRVPRTMVEFIQEHLSRVFGIPKIANRQLAQIIPALKQLYQHQDPYGVFYCKLFQIFDPEPIPLNFAVFITRARFQFQEQIEKLERTGINIKKSRVSRGKKDMIDELRSGGSALATDVIDLVNNIFENHRAAGIIALKRMRPDEVSVEDYVTFQICQKIIRLGKTIEGVFNIIDRDASLSIDKKELSQFSRASIDLWVDDDDLESCFNKLVTNGTEEIPKEVFMTKFSIKNYQELTKNRAYVITKAKFLNVLYQVYKDLNKVETANLTALLQGFSAQMTKDDFRSALNALNPEMNWRADRYIGEAFGPKTEISHFEFIKIIHKYGLGGYKKGPFAIKEMYEDLEEKKVKTTLDESIINSKIKSTEDSRERSRTINK